MKLHKPIKISHIADVHFRALNRHDEYKKIFEEYVVDVQSQGVDHIFIGGDIFHTKTSGISPEYIDVMVWWFNALASVADVHVMLGNHDGNLVNASRQDAISPILAALRHPRIKLYKDSGVYSIESGLNLCVFSLFDEAGWSSVKPVEGDVNIACYHGAMAGAKTETGWELEDGVELQMFDGYDACFLGDIHHPQILGYRSQNGKNVPWIAYPGSTIQQNYGEQQDHFHILWTIRGSNDHDFQYRKLPNPHPFVTLVWAGGVEQTLESASKVPHGARFRIKIPDFVSQKEIHDITKKLRRSHSAAEVTFAVDQKSSIAKDVVTASGITFTKSDLRNPETLTKLMRDAYKKAEVSDVDWKRIFDMVVEYLGSATKTDDSPRNVTWSLRKLSFDNTFTYGENNHISFEDLSGVVGLFGRNRIGKSSVVGSLLYALFNATDRGAIKNLHVINARKQYCSARAVVNVAGVDYVIERQTVKNESKKGAITASTALNLFKMDGDELVDLVGEQRNDTEKLIRAIIGTVEDFMTTSASTQGDINRFIHDGSAQRKTFVSKLLDLNVFEALHGLVKDHVADLKARIKVLPPEIDAVAVDEMKTRLQTCRNLSQALQEDIQSKRLEVTRLHTQLAGLERQSVMLSDVQQQRDLLDRIGLAVQKFGDRRDVLAKDLAAAETELKSVAAGLGGDNSVVLRRQIEELVSVENKLNSARRDLEGERRDLARHLRVVQILDEVPCGDGFPSCKFIKDAHEARPQEAVINGNIDSLLETISRLSSTVEQMSTGSPRERLLAIELQEQRLSELKDAVAGKKLEIADADSKLDKLSQQMQTASEKLADMESAFSAERNTAIAELRGTITGLEQDIKRLDESRSETIAEAATIDTRLKKLTDEAALRSQIMDELRVRELIMHAFSKKGLPSIITGIQLPLINAEIGRILGGIADFTVELAMEDDGALEVYINYGDSRRLIELGSGMEKMIASLAIRVALAQVSSLPKSDIFIIDEGFGVLDEGHVDACNKLLHSLKRYFKTILVISHSDGIKDAADVQVEVTKVENDSRINYGE